MKIYIHIVFQNELENCQFEEDSKKITLFANELNYHWTAFDRAFDFIEWEKQKSYMVHEIATITKEQLDQIIGYDRESAIKCCFQLPDYFNITTAEELSKCEEGKRTPNRLNCVFNEYDRGNKIEKIQLEKEEMWD
jgi:hypothetical protein